MVTFVPGVSGRMHTLKITSSNGARMLAQKAVLYRAAVVSVRFGEWRHVLPSSSILFTFGLVGGAADNPGPA